MQKKQGAALTWFEFSILQSVPFIRHGCFSRKGGVSLPPFDSLNVQMFPQENSSSVQENRARIQAVLGTRNSLIDLEQVHGTDIAVIKASPNKTPLGRYDAAMTNIPGIPLTIKHADCQACFLVDPEKKVIAAIHAGWRGNVQNIYGKVVEKLMQEYGSRPESLLACVSPSLGLCHAEFTNWKNEFPESFWKYKKENDCFDLWEIGKDQLLESGIKEEHIEMARLCTFDEKEDFFSFRRDGTTGRNASCIILRD